MSSGIRATVAFSEPGDCPLAAFSANASCTIEDVSTSVTVAGTPGSVTEFLAPPHEPERDDVWSVFDYGDMTLYRTAHGDTDGCPCTCVGGHGCPVHRYAADEGTLTLVFHAAEYTTLQSIMKELRDDYPPVDVQRLLQPPLDGNPEDRVFVNRGKLTDRQREVLRTALRMGYFERPKQANATDVATELDIAQSTFTEHLMAAQRKLLADILE